MGHCCVWSFGQEGDELDWLEGHKLNDPQIIATNADGQFLILDLSHSTLKVFDGGGKFVNALSVLVNETSPERIYDVATDKNGDTYVLVKVRYLCTYRVLVFDASAVLCREIELYTKESNRGHIVGQSLSLTVNANNKVLVLQPVLSEGFWHGLVDVHETNGQFICSFGKGMLKREMNVGATDIRDLKQTLEAVRWRRRWPHGSGLRPPPLGAKLGYLSWRGSGDELRLFFLYFKRSNLTLFVNLTSIMATFREVRDLLAFACFEDIIDEDDRISVVVGS